MNLHCFYNHGGNCFIKIALFYKHIFCPHSFPRSPHWSQCYGFDKKRLPTLDGSGAHLCLVTTLQWTLCCCPQNNLICHDESPPILSLRLCTLLAEMCSELSRPVSLGQKDYCTRSNWECGGGDSSEQRGQDCWPPSCECRGASLMGKRMPETAEQELSPREDL